jgi:hypothetical protein
LSSFLCCQFGAASPYAQDALARPVWHDFVALSRVFVTPLARRRTPSPPAAVRAALGSHVGHVVCSRPKEKMGGIDADSVIARVAYVHATRDRSVFKFPHIAMRSRGSRTSSESRIEGAVSGVFDGPRPQPAFVRPSLFDEFPKAHVGRDGAVRHALMNVSSYWGNGNGEPDPSVVTRTAYHLGDGYIVGFAPFTV